jgi:hypothetical protein
MALIAAGVAQILSGTYQQREERTTTILADTATLMGGVRFITRQFLA